MLLLNKKVVQAFFVTPARCFKLFLGCAYMPRFPPPLCHPPMSHSTTAATTMTTMMPSQVPKVCSAVNPAETIPAAIELFAPIDVLTEVKTYAPIPSNITRVTIPIPAACKNANCPLLLFCLVISVKCDFIFSKFTLNHLGSIK